MSTSFKQLTKEHPNEALAFALQQLEEAGIIKKGEMVSFEYPPELQKAAADGVDISNLKNLIKILDLKITGDTEQVLYTYKIKTESETHEIPVTALEFLRQGKLYNKKFDI